MAESAKLTLACDDYEFVQPLLDGRVKVPGLHLVPQPAMPIAERHRRMVHDAAFDLCELSATTYFLARERGLPLTALPIFLLRKFRHGDIYINTGCGITRPADLIGKRIGGICYQVASNVWARGILAEHYGVPHDSITWVVERDEEISFEAPAGLRIERLAKGLTLEAALLSGAIEALMSPVVPPSLLAGARRVARLFPDYKEIERAYFWKSAIFPIMHVLAVRNEVVERQPWIPASLYRAFDEAKSLAYNRAGGGRAVPLAWFGSAWEEERRALGPDPWAYGLGDGNIANLETILRYMREQGLTSTAMNAAELFIDPQQRSGS
jgi:4,5-dihydroxyphthalate decarboxylase